MESRTMRLGGSDSCRFRTTLGTDDLWDIYVRGRIANVAESRIFLVDALERIGCDLTGIKRVHSPAVHLARCITEITPFRFEKFRSVRFRNRTAGMEIQRSRGNVVLAGTARSGTGTDTFRITNSHALFFREAKSNQPCQSNLRLSQTPG